MKTTTWEKIMELKKNERAKGIANDLSSDEIETILATADFFGGNLRQIMFDLSVAKYRVFDWLAMGVTGDRIGNEVATKVFAHSFIKSEGNIDNFIADLRETDYQADESYKAVALN